MISWLILILTFVFCVNFYYVVINSKNKIQAKRDNYIILSDASCLICFINGIDLILIPFPSYNFENFKLKY